MEDRHVHTGNWYLRDRVRKLVLVIKSFCPTHVTGGCSSLEQILGLVGTDGVDYYPPADICKECEDIKKEGAYTTVARDRLSNQESNKHFYAGSKFMFGQSGKASSRQGSSRLEAVRSIQRHS